LDKYGTLPLAFAEYAGTIFAFLPLVIHFLVRGFQRFQDASSCRGASSPGHIRYMSESL
jgi:hypothetical protein